MNYTLAILLTIMFVRAKNTITTLIVFLVLMHFVEVVFVEQIFGKPFSEKADLFDTLNIVGNCLFIFAAIFYYINRNLSDDLGCRFKVWLFRPIDLLSFIFVFGFTIYGFYNSVIFHNNDYHEIASNASPIDEYILTVLIVILYCSKTRFLVLFPFILIMCTYMITGQRLKFLLMAYVLYLLFKDYFRSFTYI